MGDLVSAVTDLALGLVAAGLWWRLRGQPAVASCWTPIFGWIAAAALGGAVFHTLASQGESGADLAWNAIGLALVLSLGFLASAALQETTGDPQPWSLRAFPAVAGLAYVVLAAAGAGGPTAVAIAGSPAMATAVVLWVRAAFAHHPRAPLVLTAMVASGFAAAARAGAAAADTAALHPDGVYHLAQIPGIVLLYLAASRTRPWPAGAPVGS